MDTKILLENGTNELEVLEFRLDGNAYGINVAKIKEIITYEEVTPVPNAHPSIEGIFMPRDIACREGHHSRAAYLSSQTLTSWILLSMWIRSSVYIVFHGETLLSRVQRFQRRKKAFQQVLSSLMSG